MDLEPYADQNLTSPRDENTNDHKPVSTTPSHPQVNRREYLEWKANGRPGCPRCHKRHFGFCNTSQWEVDLINRDPEGHARHRNKLKQRRRRRNQSTTEPTSAPQNASLTFDQLPESQNQNTNASPEDDSPYILEFLVDAYNGTVPRGVTELSDRTAIIRHYRDLAAAAVSEAALR